MNTRINRNELDKWIRDEGEGGVMLTISEPHMRCHHLNLELKHMEPVVSRIVELCNRTVFGKHKRFEFMRGIIVAENPKQNPHFHIVFKKPENIDADRFKNKLCGIATKLCNESFEFNLTESCLPRRYRNALSKPCYDRFIRVTNTHENSGNYLTKSVAKYYLLDKRTVNFDTDDLELFVDFYNGDMAWLN